MGIKQKLVSPLSTLFADQEYHQVEDFLTPYFCRYLNIYMCVCKKKITIQCHVWLHLGLSVYYVGSLHVIVEQFYK